MAVKKIIELVGSSPKGWEEAVGNAVKEAAKTVRNITSAHVVAHTAKVQRSRIVEYRALVRIAFTVERGSASD
jgi:flavin-binding protein dodecin